MNAPLKKLSELTGLAFDGKRSGYVPPKRLSISKSLRLHTRHEKDIDPVTFEVIRHALWNVNEEHGATIQRLSGSPVAMYALDLNPSILTEDAEFVYFGPYMQYMSGVTDTQVKWTLENRSANPGIRDGDMFLANDPWVGAAHQMDVMLLCPVFWQGELFCWVTNCLHQYDIGGITPGSFCPSARDAYDEGILLPPIKIIENNEIRKDIEDVYLRSSRKPSAVALDFRAQLAGNMTAKDRILSLIGKYGADTVKGVMKKIITDGEAAFLKKLALLPDGVWRDRTYVECCRPGDRQVHRVLLTLKKIKNRLIFENEGTDPQAGGINATYSGWRGAIMVALNELMCWEQYYAVGGALRHVDFNPTPGTLNCADFPASVSTAPVQCMEISLYPAYNVLSKMLYPDPGLRRDAMCIGGTSQWPATIFRGIDQWGERYGYLLVDPIGGAIGAFSHADGISTGGQARTPICKLPNVEHTEQSFPVLFLYRKEIRDSGGAGKFRGGLSAESCFIPHGTDRITHDTLSSGNAVPTSTGMMGGYPGAVNRYRFLRESDIQQRFSESRLVNDIDELKGTAETLQLRQQDFPQHPNDVYAVLWSAAGGFGDPLERDPARVQADVENGDVSEKASLEIYGVVLGDAPATERRRQTIRARRVQDRSGPPKKLAGKPLMLATENLAIYKGMRYGCAKCGADLGSIRDNYKACCIRNDLPIEASNPIVGDPKRFIDPTPQFRQFCCPGCGLAIENEVAIADDPPLRDIEILSKRGSRRMGTIVPILSALSPTAVAGFSDVSYAEAMRRARECVPVLAGRAQRCEDERVLLPESEKLLHETGLFRFHQPRRFGGMELPFQAIVDIVAELARGCPSTAWNVGNLGCHHWILAYYEPETQHEVWDADPDALIASSIALAAGRGRKVDGGFVVSGRWPFSSGVDNSQWNMLAVTIYEHDKPVDWRLCLVPKSDYAIIDTWYAMGMAGTGSKDIEAKEVFVPERRALALVRCRGGSEHPGAQLNPGALFRVPIVAAAGHALSPSALGAAEGAFQHVAQNFSKRIGTYTGAKVSEFQAVQVKLARARCLIDSARHLMRESAAAFQQVAERNEVPDLETKLRFRAQNAFAVAQSREAVETLWSFYGANAIYTRDPLQRFLRDTQAINQHFSFNFDIAGAAFGTAALGGKVANPTL